MKTDDTKAILTKPKQFKTEIERRIHTDFQNIVTNNIAGIHQKPEIPDE